MITNAIGRQAQGVEKEIESVYFTFLLAWNSAKTEVRENSQGEEEQ